MSNLYNKMVERYVNTEETENSNADENIRVGRVLQEASKVLKELEEICSVKILIDNLGHEKLLEICCIFWAMQTKEQFYPVVIKAMPNEELEKVFSPKLARYKSLGFE
jgi:hypothetical protein